MRAQSDVNKNSCLKQKLTWLNLEMVQSCVVVGCTNRWQKGSKISWHRFPSEKHPDRRKKWLIAINRKNWTPTSQDRVCGIHFLTGCASQDVDNPDYAPTLHLGYENHQTSTPNVKLNRFDRVNARRSLKLEKELDEVSRQTAAEVLMDLSSTFNRSMDVDADTELTPPRPGLTNDSDETTKQLLDECLKEKQALMKELGRLQGENRRLREEVQQKTFGANFLSQGESDKKTSFYTGVPNFKTFMWLVTFLQNSLPVFTSVSAQDVVLIVLMKLRLNLQNFDIATRFNISKTTVSDILNKCLPIFAYKLKFFVHWPEKEDVLRTLPKVFKPKYKNTRTIIDCTEIFVERPGNLTARASTWSNYKHNNTVKYLVAITPLGAISFISKAFGGRVSDKVVTQRSGFLDLLENGDVVLADRGFLINEEITARNCMLAIPAFTKGQTQLTQQQVETSRYMARVRIHVERAIGRLKVFKILSTQMSLSMVPHCDNILTICSAICNLQPKLVQ